MRAVLAILLMAGCNGGADPEPTSCASSAVPTIDLAANVGLRQEAASYDVAWDGSERELELHIWYPSDDTEGDAAEYIGLFDDENSLVDASYADAEDTCTHPLVVYSHGSQAWAGNGSPILRQFVKEGWVAIGPDHLGNTLDDNWDPRPHTFSLSRVHDVRFAIDYLEGLPEDDPLHGRVDTSRVLVMGHSFGGQTSWLAGGPSFDSAAIETRCNGECSADELAAFNENPGDSRIAAVIPMAGDAGSDLVADAGFGDISVPVLYMTGSEDFDGQPRYERAAATPDLTWVDIEGGCHETFTSTVFACDGVDKDAGLEIVSKFATAQGWRSVLDSEEGASTLDGSESVSDLVTVTR